MWWCSSGVGELKDHHISHMSLRGEVGEKLAKWLWSMVYLPPPEFIPTQGTIPLIKTYLLRFTIQVLGPPPLKLCCLGVVLQQDKSYLHQTRTECDILTAIPQRLYISIFTGLCSVSGFTLFGTSLMIRVSFTIVSVLWDFSPCPV